MACEKTENSHFLGPTSITRDHVQRAFAEYTDDPNLKLRNVDAEVIGVGQGFSSYIVRLRMDWKDDENSKKKLPRSAVLKSISKDAMEKMSTMLIKSSSAAAGAEEQIGAMMMLMVAKAHDTECYLYRMFKKAAPPPPIPLVEAYALWSSQDEQAGKPRMILLEDVVSERGRVLGDGSGSLTLAQMNSIADALADLHAWCLTTTTKDEVVDWRATLETTEQRMEMLKNLFPMILTGIEKAKAVFPDEFQKLDEQKLMGLMTPEKMLEFQLAHKPWMPDVLIHGDFWANNIMFDTLPDGSMGDRLVAIIDWQMPYVGNPMYDLGRVVAMSLDHDLRKAHLRDIVKRYYDRLVQKLGPTGAPKEMTFDRILKLAELETAAQCLFLLFAQDFLQGLFAPTTSQEDQAKRERLLKRAKSGVEYAIEQFDIGLA